MRYRYVIGRYRHRKRDTGTRTPRPVERHLTRPADALREMARVSRGRIAVCEGNRNHPPMAAFGIASRVCRGLLHYSRRTLRDLAVEAGIDVVAVTLHGYVYENASPKASLPVARRLEATLPGGAYILLAGRTGATRGTG